MTQSMLVPNLPFSNSGYGTRTPWGQLLPPGGKLMAFVSSVAPSIFNGDDPLLQSGIPIMPTLATALALCRPNKGDMVMCLPGHSESVVDNTMLTNLVPGTRIIGVGQGSNQPTFRWTATAAQWILNDADVLIAGLRLRLEGANGVVVALDFSAADNSLIECDIETSSGAANLAAVAIRASAGATRFFIGGGTRIRGVVAGVSTDIVLVNAAVDGLIIKGIRAMAPSTNGLFRTAAAATNMLVDDCRYYNTSAAVGAVCGAQAADGVISDSHFAVTGAAAAGTAITQGSATFRLFNSFFSDGTFLFGIPIGTTAA